MTGFLRASPAGRRAAAVLFEGSILLINSLFALVWLCRLEIQQNMNTIRAMVLTTLLISFVLIPVEPPVFHMFGKRRFAVYVHDFFAVLMYHTVITEKETAVRIRRR